MEWTAASATWKILLMRRLPPLPVRPPSPPTRLPFRIRTLGRVTNQPYHATAGTYHDDAMLSVVRSGMGFYHRGERRERLQRGFVGLVLPSADPGLLLADVHDPYDHYYCRFAGREALRMARAIVASHGGRSFFPFRRWAEAAGMLDAMLSLDRHATPGHPDWMTQTEGALARLLSLLLLPPGAGEKLLTPSGLERYLLDHIAEPFELDRAAEHFGVSRFHLSRRARALLGDRLEAVSRRLKLEFALSLLDATSPNLGVADVARRVGYDDPLYFSRVFRRHMGVSPSRYRAESQRRRP
jgi:AraC family transcriptional regulator, arabinose operon regulatory protein